MTTANPAAGANASIAAPANSRSQLVALSFGITTDANVADRLLRLDFTHGGIVVTIAISPLYQTASETLLYVANPAQTYLPAKTTSWIALPIPDSPLFVDVDTLALAIANIQAADQISTIRTCWKIWITG